MATDIGWQYLAEEREAEIIVGDVAAERDTGPSEQEALLGTSMHGIQLQNLFGRLLPELVPPWIGHLPRCLSAAAFSAAFSVPAPRTLSPTAKAR